MTIARPPKTFLQAFSGLFVAANLSDSSWAILCKCHTATVDDWRSGKAVPEDGQMTKIIAEMGRIKGSEKNPDLPAALDLFWQWIAYCEGMQMLPERVTGRLPQETISQRLTRFTNLDRGPDSIWRNIHLVHPSRRAELFAALTETFNQFVPDGE